MTALPPLADVRDLELRMKRTFDTAADVAEVESALDEASELVRTESGDSWTINTPPNIIKIIVLRAAERKLRNPDGLSAESLGGDYSYERPGVGAEGGLYLTDWEVKVLRRRGGQPGVWTAPLDRGDVTTGMVFAEDSFGLELFPVGDDGVFPYSWD